MKYGLLFFCLLVSGILHAGNPLVVGIFQGYAFNEVKIEVVSGSYNISNGSAVIFTMGSGKQCQVNTTDSRVSIAFGDNASQSSAWLRWKGTGEFRISPQGQKATGRIFSGELIVKNAGGKIVLLNLLDVEDYIPGVIEAEAGPNHTAEYYKVQAIISRTYALNNLRRHEAEGFNLCDQTHCQVYHGKPRFVKEAFEAVESTNDVVIVDDDINLITAAFHSNCGGHTVNSEHVWSKPLSYCVGRRDTFCLVMPHSNWEKTIPLEQWTSYLDSKRYPMNDSLSASALAYFPSQKEVYFVDESTKIPTRVIRSDMKLRSSFFTVHQQGESVTFIGQGFGHGVGLCQEGAMRMAELGYSYQDIIHFYYAGVHLVPKRFIWFFKED